MIYFFDNYNSFNLENAKILLPEDRLKRVERYRRQRDKENCAVGYLLLKKALCDMGINVFTIGKGEKGKPYLIDSPVYFNISHCDCGVAVAVSMSPVGVDVQNISQYNKGVAKRVFTPEEISRVEISADPDRCFTQLWTIKEAMVKYTGNGISDIEQYSFENFSNHFEKYGRKFHTIAKENLFISLCGNEDFFEIKEIKSLEVF